MSDLLLINPKINRYSQSRIVNSVINISFPSSLGVLAGYLMAGGDVKSVEIVDEQIIPFDNESLAEQMAALKEPRIVGLSVLTLNCGRAYELADMIKKIDPKATVIFGGIHPSVRTDEVIQHKSVDIAVRGEGEKILRELVSHIHNQRDYGSALGISYISKDGAPVHNAGSPLIDNLDDIPPFPYELFEKHLHRYPNFSGIFGSRGCPYKCVFCSSRSISGMKYRFNSVGRIISEMKILIYKYGQKSIFLMDDNIAMSKRHFIDLCEAIIKEGLHKEVYFHGSMRGDNAKEEILEKAAEANFKIIYYGLETGTERLMKVIDKGETLEEIIDAIKRTDKRGIAVGATIIFGLPTETRKDRWDTMKLARSLPLSSLRFNTMAPYPGTPAYIQYEPLGKVLIRPDWANFGVQYMWEGDDIPYVPDGNDRLELIFDTMFANFSYYLSYTGIKKTLFMPVAGGNVIKLHDKWYFSIVQLSKITLLFLYLARRFISVTARMLWNMLKRKITGPKAATVEGEGF
jgi:radical SAM superfamily enzyme YgiQ (UPF0313 family)